MSAQRPDNINISSSMAGQPDLSVYSLAGLYPLPFAIGVRLAPAAKEGRARATSRVTAAVRFTASIEPISPSEGRRRPNYNYIKRF